MTTTDNDPQTETSENQTSTESNETSSQAHDPATPTESASPTTAEGAPIGSENAALPAATSQADSVEKSAAANVPAGNTPVEKKPGEKKILIGSQRDAADRNLAPSKPKAVQAAKANPVELGGEKPSVVEQVEMPEIKSMAGLGDDLDAEIEAALGGMSIEEMVEGGDSAVGTVAVESRLKASITEIHKENVMFQLPGHMVGMASLRQFKEPPEVGQEFDVVVNSLNEEEGTCEVSIPGASISVGDWSDLAEGAVVEARVSGSNTGGLEVEVNNIRGFVPASQIDIVRTENFGDFANQKLQCLVMEVNPEKRRLVLSRRALLERERQSKRQELLQTIEAGQLHDGTVIKIMDFGAFVDIGGIEGLCHVSKLSWDRVSHPKDVVSEGEKVKVKVESIDKATGKMSLSIRDTLQDPWSDAAQKYPEGSLVNGTVTRIAQFGAFVKLEPGIEGLIHISELAHHRVFAVKNIVNEGDTVEVKVLSFDKDAQKIGLSLKATQAKPEKKQDKSPEEEAANEPVREAVIKKSSEPLKGGRDKPSGGEKFGLNW